MAELLLELFSEEIPARMQDRAREDLAKAVSGILAQAGLACGRVRSFATPRRLALAVDDVPERQGDRTVERRGPREDAPDAAKAGFFRSLEGTEHTIEAREEKKGRILYALIRETGRPTAAILAEGLPEILARFPWPKSMRWGEGEVRWVRPLHSILCLLGGEVVPFAFGGIESGRTTRGHRFMAPEPFDVRDFADYAGRLREARVMLDGAERRELIAGRAAELAREAGFVLQDDPALLDEVKGLAEWPVPLLGRIDQAFMSVPSEALVATMRANQKYLILRDESGALAPAFVVVSAIAADDGGAAIVAGNERVLRARLWDARFFWEQDQKQPLESRLPMLDKMIFHAELGTLGEKVERLVALTGMLLPHLPGTDRNMAERAALLAKADLVSGMVGEFPELQGIMGAHYARAQNESGQVVQAIGEHYSPKGPEDSCPSAPDSVAVALADRIDTLAGFFAKGIRPTGSKDPFALRRAALGIIRLVLENRLRLPLRAAFKAAVQGYGDRLGGVDAESIASDLLAFFADRLKVHLREQGVRHDLVSAVFAAEEDDDLVRLLARVEALGRFLETDDGRNLLAGYRRAVNIVGIEEKKDGQRHDGAPCRDLLREEEELALFDGLDRAEPAIAAALAREDFGAAMGALAALRRPIDAFFEKVMVNAEAAELRANRLRLLARIRAALATIADFSMIEEPGRA
ncbi:glycine--tRNA ligase subunit beta [Geminicoccaceae bacterium 1502E]|nr:glycine--tRNA ligase subunit beta [Geminicoccaceae bacterium 1502E]